MNQTIYYARHPLTGELIQKPRAVNNLSNRLVQKQIESSKEWDQREKGLYAGISLAQISIAGSTALPKYKNNGDTQKNGWSPRKSKPQQNGITIEHLEYSERSLDSSSHRNICHSLGMKVTQSTPRYKKNPSSKESQLAPKLSIETESDDDERDEGVSMWPTDNESPLEELTIKDFMILTTQSSSECIQPST